MQVVRRALRVGGGLEDEARIVLQNFQPVGDVGGVLLARLACQFQIRAQERGSQLGDEFFLRVAFIAPLLAAEVARKARRVLRPVRHLMRESGVVALGVAERLERRHLNIIDFLRIIGAIAAMADRGLEAAKNFSARSMRATGSSLGAALA